MNFAFGVILVYLIASLLWIVGSDQLVLWLARTPEQTALLQTGKGLIFVLASAAVMAWLVATQRRVSGRHVAVPTHAEAAASALFPRPLVAAFLVFLLALGVSAVIIRLAEHSRVLTRQQQAHATANDHARLLEEQIYRSLSATYALAAVLRQGHGEIPNFETLAREMLPLYPGVSALQLAPGGVIRHSVPLEGNEKAIGHELLKDPERNKEAFLAVETRKLTLAGPLELIQGGVAVIGRLPLFLPDNSGTERFWGFITALVRIEDLISASRMDALVQDGYHYKLWRIHPDTGQMHTFVSSTQSELREPIAQELEVPNGRWTLSVAPVKGWHATYSLIYETTLALLASLIAALAAYRAARQPETLHQLVAERTLQLGTANVRLRETMRVRLDAEQQLKLSEERFRNLVEATSDWVWEVDENGIYTYASPKVRDILGYEPEEVVGKTPFDLMPQDEARRIGAVFGAFAAEQKSFAMLENVNLHKDGHEVVLETSGVPIYDDTGHFRGYRGIDRDITPRKRAEARVRKLSRAVEQSANAVIVTDLKGDIEYVNPKFCELTGYSADEVVGQNPRLLKSGEHPPEVYREMWDTLLAGKEWFGEFLNRKKNGEVFWCLESISSIRDEQGGITHFVSITEDISSRKLAESTIRQLAYYDTLTGLPNRRLFRDRLEQAAANARRGGHSLALLYLDLDRLKYINDTLGHAIGDALLKAVAERLTATARQEDTVARLEGDEFAVLLANIRTVKNAARVTEKLTHSLKRPFNILGHELFVTVSIGISLYPQDSEDLDTLNQNADLALHRAKELGDNFGFFTADMNAAVLQHLIIENNLRHALERHELVLHFQPQMDIATGHLSGAEALLRWRHPDLGLVPPDQFIPLAEETGLIIPIGTWVLKEACTQARAWQADGRPPLAVAVNLSARQFRDKELLNTIAATLSQSGLQPELLELEITESMLMERTDEAPEKLHQLRAKGISIVIDDFGTGYSSLAYLKRLPIQVLKIDKSFVRDIGTDPDDRAIVSAVVALAHTLKLKVIAEGVETREQLDFLHSLNCDNLQGYLYSHPLDAAEFRAMLAEGRTPKLPCN